MTILRPNTTKDGAGESPLSEADVEADRISRLNFAAEASHKLEGTELSPHPHPRLYKSLPKLKQTRGSDCLWASVTRANV